MNFRETYRKSVHLEFFEFLTFESKLNPVATQKFMEYFESFSFRSKLNPVTILESSVNFKFFEIHTFGSKLNPVTMQKFRKFHNYSKFLHSDQNWTQSPYRCSVKFDSLGYFSRELPANLNEVLLELLFLNYNFTFRSEVDPVIINKLGKFRIFQNSYIRIKVRPSCHTEAQ